MTSGAGDAPFTELSARPLGPFRRYFAAHPAATDVAVMAVFAFLAATTALGGAASTDTSLADPPFRRMWTISIVVGAVATVVLFWRRRAPVTTSGVMVALFVVSAATTGGSGLVDLGLALTLYCVAASRPAWVAWATFGGGLAVTATAVILWFSPRVALIDESGAESELDTRTTGIVSLTLALLIALAIGTSVRNRRQRVSDLVARANALARERDQQAELARAAERSRIAREMHDVVAHSLSVMIALADGAGAALGRAPDQARTALGELSDTGRTALADMRRVLGVLETDAPLEPPGSADLAALVERFRTAGLAVRTEGLGTDLGDTGLQLAVYRIVQEGLTNVLRYAPDAAQVLVRIRAVMDQVEVEVVDSGGGGVTEQVGAGRGLIGMVERAKVYGGDVKAGPWQSGWRVRATLPTKGER